MGRAVTVSDSELLKARIYNRRKACQCRRIESLKISETINGVIVDVQGKGFGKGKKAKGLTNWFAYGLQS